MKRRLLIASIFILSVLGLVLAGPKAPAQDPEPPPAEAEAPDDEPLEVFEPTEKLTADSAVSFPVDI